MYYVIQENVFREHNYSKIFDVLTKLDLPFEVVSIPPNTEDLTIESDRTDIFPFGSVRLANISAKNNWNPGSFFGNNHDYSVYSEYYRDNLLNWGCDVQDITDNIDWLPNEMKFIRPSKDSKVFNGAVYTKIKWDDIVLLVNGRYDGVIPDIAIQVNSVKKIYKEARVWIVGGKVITSSYYKYNENVVYISDVEPDGLAFAQSMVDIYQVADSFVMDICLTPDGWKIVEINCVNCSGFYEGDLQKLVIALEDFFNPEKS
jgi:hypothetical protein